MRLNFSPSERTVSMGHHLPYRTVFYFFSKSAISLKTLRFLDRITVMSFARHLYGSRFYERKNGARLAIWRGLIFLAAFSAIPRPGLVSGRLGWAQNAEIFWESLFKKKLFHNFYFYEQNKKKRFIIAR